MSHTRGSDASTLLDSSTPPAQPPKASDNLDVPIEKLQSKKRLWKPYVTPIETILNHHYPGSGTDEDPYVIDWLPSDPEDPQRWSGTYKWTTIAIVSWATLAVALSSSAYSGGVESLIKSFHASEELLIAGVSLFVVGFAFGPLLWAPMSEVFGRRKVFIISYFFLTLWQGVSIASPNIGALLVFRFLAGFFGSSPLANAGGTISDVLDANQRGLGMALFAAAPFLGPSLGPITGGFLGLSAGWKWVFGFLAIFTGVLTVVLLFFGAETYAPYLLRQRAAKLSKATGKVYRYRPDAKKAFDPKQLFKGALLRPWKFLIYEPIVIILTIYTALVYGVLYLNFAAYPIVFQQGRGWNSGIGGLAFLGITVGTVISVMLSIFYINPQYIKTAKKKGGRADPEDRLPPAIWGGVLIVIGLAGFAATDGPNVHWIAPIIFGIPFGVGVITMFLAVLGYLVDSYTIYAASVLAANSVLRSLFGAAFPLFTSYMYKALGIHWAAALPGFIALACIPFAAIFYKYGAKIRAKCKYAADAERQMAAIMAARMAAMKKDEEDNTATNGNANGNANVAPKGDEEKMNGSAPIGKVGSQPQTRGSEGVISDGHPEAGNPPAPDAEKNDANLAMAAGTGPSDQNELARIGSLPAPQDLHPSDPNHPYHHEWTIYEVLADRDEVDLSDDERRKLYELDHKFDHAKTRPNGKKRESFLSQLSRHGSQKSQTGAGHSRQGSQADQIIENSVVRSGSQKSHRSVAGFTRSNSFKSARSGGGDGVTRSGSQKRLSGGPGITASPAVVREGDEAASRRLSNPPLPENQVVDGQAQETGAGNQSFLGHLDLGKPIN